MAKYIPFVIIFLISRIPLFSQSEKVLFIGNSLTYFNDMPEMFEQICKEYDLELEVESSCFSGVNLMTHTNTFWYKNKGFNVYNPPTNSVLSKKYKVDTCKAVLPTTIDKIITDNYRYIFLQEQPNYIFNSELRNVYTKPSIKIIDSLTQKNQAELFLAQTYTGKKAEQLCLAMTKCEAGECDKLFYCSHDFKSFEEMTDTIVNIYKEITIDLGIKTIPIAEVFEHFRKQQPRIKLYKQGNHPTKQASFIMACTHFYSITGKKDYTEMVKKPFRKHFDLISDELLIFFNEYDLNNQE
nr:hypothetical protein [uncultured Brumimicrobium sp.]